MESWMYITASTISVLWFLNHNVENIWPAPLALKEKNKGWWWRYVICGQLFACVSGIGSVYCFYEKPAMLEDLINSCSHASYNVVAIALGYFVFELVNAYLYAPRWWFSACFYHHAIVIGVYVIAFVNKKYISFSTIVLFVEVYSIFLYFDRFLRAVGANESGKVYRTNTIIVLVTLTIRAFFTCWILYFVIGLWKSIPTIDFLAGLGGATYIFQLNHVLFKKAWKNAVKAWAN